MKRPWIFAPLILAACGQSPSPGELSDLDLCHAHFDATHYGDLAAQSADEVRAELNKRRLIRNWPAVLNNHVNVGFDYCHVVAALGWPDREYTRARGTTQYVFESYDVTTYVYMADGVVTDFSRDERR